MTVASTLIVECKITKKIVEFFEAKQKPIIFALAWALAQLVEQRTENPCVPGSIPRGIIF